MTTTKNYSRGRTSVKPQMTAEEEAKVCEITKKLLASGQADEVNFFVQKQFGFTMGQTTAEREAHNESIRKAHAASGKADPINAEMGKYFGFKPGETKEEREASDHARTKKFLESGQSDPVYSFAQEQLGRKVGESKTKLDANITKERLISGDADPVDYFLRGIEANIDGETESQRKERIKIALNARELSASRI